MLKTFFGKVYPWSILVLLIPLPHTPPPHVWMSITKLSIFVTTVPFSVLHATTLPIALLVPVATF